MQKNKLLFHLIIVFFAFSSLATTNTLITKENIKYKLFSDSEKFNGSGLIAILNSKIITIIDTSEHLFLTINQEFDFDSDGNFDLLMSDDTESGGGNCCASKFFIISYLGNGNFIRTEYLGQSFQDPQIEKWENSSSIIISITNEGVNNDDFEELNERYILKSGQIYKVEEIKSIEIKAVQEMRASQFTFGKENEIHSLKVDLDGDGQPDEIIGTFYERWGRISWKINFSNNLVFETDIASKRIGVLSTKTNGVYDLVTDLNTIWIWTNGRYLNQSTQK